MVDIKMTELAEMDEFDIEETGFDLGLNLRQVENLVDLSRKYYLVITKGGSCPGAEKLADKLDTGITIEDLKKELDY